MVIGVVLHHELSLANRMKLIPFRQAEGCVGIWAALAIEAMQYVFIVLPRQPISVGNCCVENSSDFPARRILYQSLALVPFLAQLLFPEWTIANMITNELQGTVDNERLKHIQIRYRYATQYKFIDVRSGLCSSQPVKWE